jgi:hypothetical protein
VWAAPGTPDSPLLAGESGEAFFNER